MEQEQVIKLKITTGCPDMPSNSKPRLQGLCLRQHHYINNMDNPDENFYKYVEVIVIRVHVKDIWPSEDRFDFSQIDDMLTWARKMKSRGLNIKFKLRVVAGMLSGEWLINKCDKFLFEKSGYETTPGFEDASDYCPSFWGDTWLMYWERLMTKLADHYDEDPYLSEITVTGSATGTGEPMIWGIGNNDDYAVRRDQMIAAGANPTNTLSAIYSCIDIMQVFKRTNIGIPLTEFQHCVKPFFQELDTAFEIGEYMANLFKGRCVLGNNGLRVSDSTGGDKWTAPDGVMWQLQMHYIHMKFKHGSGIYNQTASVKNMGGESNIIPTLNAGLGYMDGMVELPGGETDIKGYLNVAQLALYEHLYKKNEPN